MNNPVFDKTIKGREEIATRRYHLASRMRSLLVLVDGKKSAAELLQQVAGLGLDASSIEELAEGGFIEALAPAVPEPVVDAPDRGANPDPANEVESDGGQGEVRLIAAGQILALQTFLTETIKSTLGLRGFALQLKVDRAMGIEDFQKLRQPYLEAIQKAKGYEIFVSLRERLDLLLEAAEQSTRQ